MSGIILQGESGLNIGLHWKETSIRYALREKPLLHWAETVADLHWAETVEETDLMTILLSAVLCDGPRTEIAPCL